MIVEVLGTGGAGKTTLEPLLAGTLGMAHFPAGKRRDIEGKPQATISVWATRIAAVAASPRLFFRAQARIPDSPRNRLWFAMDLCRRERNARIARRERSGVLASGTLHALAQGSARFGADLSDLVTSITSADLYVRLRLDSETAASRLADRRQVGLERVGDHSAWTLAYEAALDAALARLQVPVIEADAARPPQQIAADVASRIVSLRTG